MKYYVFGGEDYYPSGGVDDLMQTFDDLDMAISWVKSRDIPQYGGLWYQIVNENMQKVKEYNVRNSTKITEIRTLAT